MLITRKSMMTGKTHTLEVPITAEQLREVEFRNEPIQNICPDLDKGLREFLINGTTPKEWSKMFGGIEG